MPTFWKPKRHPRGHRRGRRSKSKLARVRKAVVFRDGGRCRVCPQGNGTELHHIVFRSLGGEHSTANCILLCTDCHRAVHATRSLTITGNGDSDLLIERAA